MRKLFGLSHSRILSRLSAAQITPVNAEQILKKNEIHSSTEAILHRLPRQELRQILKAICPVNSLEQNNANDIITSAKRLRHHVNFNEAKICYKCPFVTKCHQAKKPWKEQRFQHPAKDLLVYYSELNNYLQPQRMRQRQWIAGYKLADSIITTLDDLAKGGKQTEEHEVHRLASIKVFEERNASKVNNQSRQQLGKQVGTEDKDINVAKSQIFGRDFSYDDYDDKDQLQKTQDKSNNSNILKQSKTIQRNEKPKTKIKSNTTKSNEKIVGQQRLAYFKQKQDKIYRQFQREEEKDNRQQDLKEKRANNKKGSFRKIKSEQFDEDQFIIEDNQFRLKGGKSGKGQTKPFNTQSQYSNTNYDENESFSQPIKRSVRTRHRTKPL